MEPHFGLPPGAALQFPASAFAAFHQNSIDQQRAAAAAADSARYAAVAAAWESHHSAAVAAAAARAGHPSYSYSATHGLTASPTNSSAFTPGDLSFLGHPYAAAAAAARSSGGRLIGHPPFSQEQEQLLAATAPQPPQHLFQTSASTGYRINPYVEHLYGSAAAAQSAAALCGLSPIDSRGLPTMHTDYLTQMASLTQRTSLDLHASLANSSLASTDLPFSVESSRQSLSNSRSGLVRNSRKRALSNSPYAEAFDLNSMIRFSPNSLVSLVNGSRSSSAGSGSYGHLSAGVSPALTAIHPLTATSAHLQQLHQIMRARVSPYVSPYHSHSGSFLPPPLPLPGSRGELSPPQHHPLTPTQHSLQMLQSQLPPLFNPFASAEFELGLKADLAAIRADASKSSSLKSGFTLNHSEQLGPAPTHEQPLKRTTHHHTTKIKKEPPSGENNYSHNLSTPMTPQSVKSVGTPSSYDVNSVAGETISTDPMKDEPGDFMETNCHWTDCGREFCTQEELVKHINNDHICTNKKSFICKWFECSREEKPFKAQYMLVVHMRRHTGEKPHRCTFEGCAKAYSRLENLKTHLRSHTGEKPYLCEFPGCTKAFSNASDRAKHQNRTHSNEKPYVCKAPGCTKRYTDPSSLRKHVKTVHGPEFYANKKHKACDGPQPSPASSLGRGNNGPRSDIGSPKSIDDSMGKTPGSVSSPSVKSEEPSSPAHRGGSPANPRGGNDPSAGSRMHAAGDNQANIMSICGRGGYLAMGDDDCISDNNVSTTHEDNDWRMAIANAIDMPEEMPNEMARVSLPVGVSGGGGSNDQLSPLRENEAGRSNRFRGRMQAKQMYPAVPRMQNVLHGRGNYTGYPGNSYGVQNQTNDLCRQMTDLRTGMSTNQTPQRKHYTELQQRITTGNRRDSTSTISSYYGSMRSENSPHPLSSQFSSRGNSEISLLQAGSLAGASSGIGSSSQLNMSAASPFPDPISPSPSVRSRRSGDVDMGGASVGGGATSIQGVTASMAAHLQRLHRRAQNHDDRSSTQNLVVQTQNMSLSQMGSAGESNLSLQSSTLSNNSNLRTPSGLCEVRRSSDPVRPLDRNFSVEKRLNRFNSCNNFQQGTNSGSTNSVAAKSRHPNENVVLDEVEEDKMIEENQDLVLPDEVVKYLNEVGASASVEPARPVSTVSSQRPVSNHSSEQGRSRPMSNMSACTLPPQYPNQQYRNRQFNEQGYQQHNYQYQMGNQYQPPPPQQQQQQYYNQPYQMNNCNNGGNWGQRNNCYQQNQRMQYYNQCNGYQQVQQTPAMCQHSQMQYSGCGCNCNQFYSNQGMPANCPNSHGGMPGQPNPAMPINPTSNPVPNYSSTMQGPPKIIQCQDISQSTRLNDKSKVPPSGMKPEVYQRTLEYVKQCQTWSGDASAAVVNLEMSPGCNKVTSTTRDAATPQTQVNQDVMSPVATVLPEPLCETNVEKKQPFFESSNMVIGDMNSALNSFAEENKYLQLLH